MIETRAKIQSVVSSQIPEFVRDESPLFGEFVEEYYKSQEYQGGPVDIAENLDQYIKNDSFRQQYLVSSTTLTSYVNSVTKTIDVDSTVGFPDSYGYLKINSEIITYTSKSNRQFFGCIRAFSAITSLFNSEESDRLTFSTSSAADHNGGDTVHNLSNLFLAEFFRKYKNLYVPGLEDRSFVKGLNQALFAKQAKNLYETKGTDDSFEILFRALYGAQASIIKPFNNTIRPSDADYRITEDLVAVAISGDPRGLKGNTLYQDKVDGVLGYCYGSIENVIEFTRDGKDYYQISLDGGYDKDITLEGSLYGKFSITPSTRTITKEVANHDTLYVDSTVGFPKSGTLLATIEETEDVDGVDLEVKYTDITTNQFLGITENTQEIPENSVVRIKSSVYGYNDDGDKVEIRITGVISDFLLPGSTREMVTGDHIDVQNLGVLKPNDKKFSEWLYNVTNIFNLEKIEDLGNGNYKITANEVHLLVVGDPITLIQQPSLTESPGIIIDIPSSTTAMVEGLGSIDTSKEYKVRKEVIKAQVLPAVKQPNYRFTANVNNAYNLDVIGIVSNVPYSGPYHVENGKKMVGKHHTQTPHDIIEGESYSDAYVTSPSIPYYFNQQLNADLRGLEVKITSTFSGETISTTSNHNFITGDEVYYIPGTTTKTDIINGVGIASTTSLSLSPLIKGNYYAYKVDDTSFKLANSRSNIDSGKFITISGNAAGITTHIFASSLKNKAIDSQRLVRRLQDPVFDTDEEVYITQPGEKSGIFVNGVELANYKSVSSINYGKVEKIDVLGGGRGYDVINPPRLIISDTVGAGATGYVNVEGSFEKINVKYEGFDYLDNPQIKISGGNGEGATAIPKMKQKTHSAIVDVTIGINTTNNTIGFTTYHLFNAGDAVFYRLNKGSDELPALRQIGSGTTSLGDGAIYYVKPTDDLTIKLYSSYDDSISGINTIGITSTGAGTQKFERVKKTNIIGSVHVTNSGTGYQYKRRSIAPLGVSTANHTITYDDHGYKDGEVLTYANNGTVIGGLVTTAQYQVIKVDDNQFRLALAGVGGTLTTSYDNGTYVKFTSVGVGTHTFNYQPISVSVTGEIGISSSLGDYNATLTPVVRGSITEVDLSNNGTGYGNSSILNYKRHPSISFESGTGAELRPIILEGQIDSVAVTKGGSGYNSPPEIVISGIGTYASLTPVITNGVVTSVTVVNGGVGFVTDRSFLKVETAVNALGKAATVEPVITEWQIDNVNRYKTLMELDDGFMEKSTSTFGSQFTHLYAPRKLRESLPALKLNGEKDYGHMDLEYDNAEEISSNHSPIIGWAYDGNPIYGPYGFERIDGGNIKRLVPGYELKTSRVNGPNVADWPFGSFVQDYTFTNSGDLDDHNGRFCKTPDYPEGTYAYFATIDDSATPDPVFDRYFNPVFPYAIGDSFKSKPDKFNFDPNSNTDKIDFNKGEYVRNTYPYKLSFTQSDYEFVERPDKFVNDFGKVVYAAPGEVEGIKIEAAGYDYKVGDRITFDNFNSGGKNASAKITQLEGKDLVKISSSTTKKENVTFELLSDKNTIRARTVEPHAFQNGDYVSVSGMSSQSILNIDGIYNIGVTTSNFKLATGIGSTGTTGIVTYITVNGDVNLLHSDDVIGISTEQLFVLNIDEFNSRVRVIREHNSTVGTSYTATTLIEEKPRALTINVAINTDKEVKLQRTIYFDPSESVGLGTFSGVGIGTTVTGNRWQSPVDGCTRKCGSTVTGYGATSRLFPQQQLFLPNHRLTTGQALTYSTGAGIGLSVANSSSGYPYFLTDQQTVYAINRGNDFVGLSTMPVGLGSEGTLTGVSTTPYELYYYNVGSGTTHSLTTQDTQLTGNLEKVVITATASTAHGLGVGDTVFLDVDPGITSTHTLKFNDFNRRTTVGLSTFVQDNVNTTTNTISITNHGLSTGDEVIYESTSVVSGLTDNTLYYVIKESKDSLKLATNNYNATLQYPVNVSLANTGGAVTNSLLPVNPLINVVRGQKLRFNVADTSLSVISGGTTYSAFSVDFYTDQNFRNKFLTSSEDKFDVITNSTAGKENATLTLETNSKTPNILYYKLSPINQDKITEDQLNIIIDKTVKNYNTIKLNNSTYDGKYTLSSIGSTTFSFNVPKEPESALYYSTEAEMSYKTTSWGALGGIGDIKITNGGYGYNSIPGITTVRRTYTGTAATSYGNGSILRIESNSIGDVKSTEIVNAGYEFPYDKTLRPTAALPTLLKIDRFRTIEKIGLNSGGTGYVTPPDFIVKDRVGGNILTEMEIRGVVGGSEGVSEVKIVKNTKRLQDPDPKIIPIHNPNGVGIETVGFTTSTATVVLTLDTDFSSTDTFPFNVGDTVLVEGVGIASTGYGYNSYSYDYDLFTLSSTDPKIGGSNPTISFVLDNDNPGTYDPDASLGRVIPEKWFPGFNPVTKKGDFSIGETVTQESSTGKKSGKVVGWNANNNTLRVSTSDIFVAGKEIKGASSRQEGNVFTSENFDSTFEVGPLAENKKGFQQVVGFLNDNRQRLHDNDYYQSFAYSVKSPVQYATWKDVVSEITHTSGFKKFSDLQLESFAGRPSDADEQGEGVYGNGGYGFPNPSFGGGVGVATNQEVSVKTDLISVGDVDCMGDFDNSTELTVQVAGVSTANRTTISNEIVFDSRILTDYIEARSNRALSVDDIGDSFHSTPRTDPFETVDSFVNGGRYRAHRYFYHVKDTRYSNETQTGFVNILSDGSKTFISEYSMDTHGYLGSFDFKYDGGFGELDFYPEKYKLNNYVFDTICYDINHNTIGVGDTTVGDIVTISGFSTTTSAGAATTVLGLSTTGTYGSKVIVELSQTVGGASTHQYQEVNICHAAGNDSTTAFIDYGKMETGVGLGTFDVSTNSAAVNLNFYPASGIDAACDVKIINQQFNNATGVGTTNLEHGLLESFYTSITASGTPGENKIAGFTSTQYEGAYFIISAEDTTNNRTSIHEAFVAHDDDGGTNPRVYSVEWGSICSDAGVPYTGFGTVGYGFTGSDFGVYFTPDAATAVKVRVLAFAVEDNNTGYGSTIGIGSTGSIGQLRSGEGTYTGTLAVVKRNFDLNHRSRPIFEKIWSSDDGSTVDLTANTLRIPDHFLVSGEEITYNNNGSGITTSGGVIGTTSYVVKVNEELIQLAKTASNALAEPAVPYDFATVGTGNSHKITSLKQDTKLLVSLDNNIQAPVVSTGVTVELTSTINASSAKMKITGISSFIGGDLIKIDQEYMRITSTGYQTTDGILVDRGWLGSTLGMHTTGAVVTKYSGNYTVLGNSLNFVEPPYGNEGYAGITTRSTFQGRVFIRKADSSDAAAYEDNYIFDSISNEFTGIAKTFTLTSGGANVTGFSTYNGVFLVNEILQGPDTDFTLSQHSSGISSITFTGAATSVGDDVNVGTIPRGGIIANIGSSEGFGYQPLVAAGGTAIVSLAGTVTSVSLGNTGSGYRSGIQTVGVGIKTEGFGADNYVGIGTATIVEGHITGIAITNGHIFYKPRDITNVGYTSITGLTTVTTRTAHGLAAGDDVQLSGVAFTCTYSSSKTITGVAYSAASGIMTVTTSGVHGYAADQDVILTGIAMSCGLDAGIGTHLYPRKRDPFYDTAVAAASTTNTTITLDIGVAAAADQYAHTFVGTGNTQAVLVGGDYAHTFVVAEENTVSVTGWTTSLTPKSATYTPSSGSLVLGFSTNHNLTTSNTIGIGTSGMTFTCAMDGHGTQHSYPRLTDPIHNNTTVAISATTLTTFTVNVGASTAITHDVSAATYNQSTGALALTVGAGHSVTTGESVKIAKEALIFTCAKDSNATQHKYPRAGDPYYAGTRITSVPSTTKFVVNVGISTVETFYRSGGTCQGVIIAPRANQADGESDPASNGSVVNRVIDTTSFEINTGISTRNHLYARGGTVTKPTTVVIDDPLSYSDIPLVAAGGSTTNGENATVDVVVGQGSSIVNYTLRNTGYNYDIDDILSVPIGGTTGIPTTSSYVPFYLSVEDIHNDSFSGWTFGQLQVLDDFSSEFDGVKKSFTLSLNDVPLSLRAAKGSPIRIQENLLIFINNILQEPPVAYEFNGGSVIDFTEAPKTTDSLKVLYFKGSDADAVFVDIVETIKEGDKVRLRDDSTRIDTFGLGQNNRLVTGITTTDSIKTTQYFGPGITTDTTLQRPLTWCKQKSDVIVDGKYISKSRIVLESGITPATRIIQNVGIGSTTVYVQSVRPLFSDSEEAYTGSDLNLYITDENADKVSAAATATVSGLGTISALTITSAGLGYTATPTVSISTYSGVETLSTASATISGGKVTALTVDTPGAGYTSSTTPIVLISEPTAVQDTLKTPTLTGDFGIISGIAATTVGTAVTGFVLELFVDELMRNTTRVGTAVTISQIEAGDFFYVYDTSVGAGVTSYADGNGTSVVGVGTTFINNIYRAQAVEYALRNVVGVGTTGIQRVTVSVSSTDSVTAGINAFYGRYSFGKVSDITRDGTPQSFSIVNTDGITGLATAAVVRRIKNVKRSY